ncbi:PTS lactose transporter subunit IIC, partial [Enterococcus faecium]
RDSVRVCMPLMIVGALAVMINMLPSPGFQQVMISIFGGESWKGFGAAAWNGTFAILTVLIAFLLAYHLAYGYRKDGVSAGVI